MLLTELIHVSTDKQWKLPLFHGGRKEQSMRNPGALHKSQETDKKPREGLGRAGRDLSNKYW